MMRMMSKFFQYLMLKEIIYQKNKMKKKMNIKMNRIFLQKKKY